MWQQTVADDELDIARQGGSKVKKVSEKMLHDIQRILSRLVAKAPQLIGNFTTNLAEAWMHTRCKFLRYTNT